MGTPGLDERIAAARLEVDDGFAEEERAVGYGRQRWLPRVVIGAQDS